MNTKVEEALGVLAESERWLIAALYADAAEKHKQARTTLAAHIAQQDATIARLREALADLLREAKLADTYYSTEAGESDDYDDWQAAMEEASEALKDSP